MLRTFQGLQIHPAFGQTIDTCVEFLKVTYPAAYAALYDATEKVLKPVAIEGIQNWFLLFNGNTYRILYLPPQGISGKENVVKEHFQRARTCKLVATFRPLQWSEAPKNATRKPLTATDSALSKIITIIRSS